jgi:hypothetical protein
MLAFPSRQMSNGYNAITLHTELRFWEYAIPHANLITTKLTKAFCSAFWALTTQGRHHCLLWEHCCSTDYCFAATFGMRQNYRSWLQFLALNHLKPNQRRSLTKAKVQGKFKTSSLPRENHSCVRNALLVLENRALWTITGDNKSPELPAVSFG